MKNKSKSLQAQLKQAEHFLAKATKYHEKLSAEVEQLQNAPYAGEKLARRKKRKCQVKTSMMTAKRRIAELEQVISEIGAQVPEKALATADKTREIWGNAPFSEWSPLAADEEEEEDEQEAA